MRIILKILAAPFVALLTLAVGLLSFLRGLAGVALDILCGVVVLCALFDLIVQQNTGGAIRSFIIAFVISPAGLPAVADWLIDRLEGINYSLRGFIIG